MASQGLQSYSSFLLENRKELAILLLLGAVAGAAYYFFHYSQPQEIIPLEERGVLDLQQITINDYQHEQISWKLIGNRAVVSEKSNRCALRKSISGFMLLTNPLIIPLQKPQFQLTILLSR